MYTVFKTRVQTHSGIHWNKIYMSALISIFTKEKSYIKSIQISYLHYIWRKDDWVDRKGFWKMMQIYEVGW